MFQRFKLPLAALLLGLSASLPAAQRIDVDYRVRFLPDSDQAEVTVTLERGEALRYLDFSLGDQGYYSDFQAQGEWQQSGPERGIWRPQEGKAQLSYRVKISHPRDNGRFDARMTPDWALLRGDDLVPPAKIDVESGVELVSRLQFELPEGWRSVAPAGFSPASSAAAAPSSARPTSPWRHRWARACGAWTSSPC